MRCPGRLLDGGSHAASPAAPWLGGGGASPALPGVLLSKPNYLPVQTRQVGNWSEEKLAEIHYFGLPFSCGHKTGPNTENQAEAW